MTTIILDRKLAANPLLLLPAAKVLHVTVEADVHRDDIPADPIPRNLEVVNTEFRKDRPSTVTAIDPVEAELQAVGKFLIADASKVNDDESVACNLALPPPPLSLDVTTKLLLLCWRCPCEIRARIADADIHREFSECEPESFSAPEEARNIPPITVID